jgi:hypothetical protein
LDDDADYEACMDLIIKQRERINEPRPTFHQPATGD